MVGAPRISGWLAPRRPARISACSQKPLPTFRSASGRLLLTTSSPSTRPARTRSCRNGPSPFRCPTPAPTRSPSSRHLCPLGWAEDSEYSWGIEEPGTREFLGVIVLRIQDDDCSDVGYWLAPGARGRGVMTQALSAVCEFATGRLGHDVVRWEAVVGNEASRRAAERVGFEIGPPVRGLVRRRGERLDGWAGTLVPTDTPRLPPPVLTDGVVTLRAARGADIEVLPDLVDDDVLTWTGVPGRSRAELQTWLDVVRRPQRPPAARFAITDAADRLQGFVRLTREPISESVTVGWWLGPEARGRGYAGRAVGLALGWSAAQGARRFAAGIFDGNGASIALAERLGMQPEGLRRGYWPARTQPTRVVTPGCTAWSRAIRDGLPASAGRCASSAPGRPAARQHGRPPAR